MAGSSEHIETYERRFDNISMAKGFITPQELVDALNIQVMAANIH